jgi:PfpI family intracellular protease
MVVAPNSGQIQGFKHDEKGDPVPVDMSLDEASPDQFDAVLLPGGALNADSLRVNRLAQDFVRQIDKAAKPIAVICHGPWLLVSAGLVNGRRMTSYHTIQDDLRNAGARWENREVVRDRNWVSSRQPTDIPLPTSPGLPLLVSRQDHGLPSRCEHVRIGSSSDRDAHRRLVSQRGLRELRRLLDSHERAVGRSEQEVRFDEVVEYVGAGGRVERPEASGLCFRQLQAGHLEELGFQTTNQAFDRYFAFHGRNQDAIGPESAAAERDPGRRASPGRGCP